MFWPAFRPSGTTLGPGARLTWILVSAVVVSLLWMPAVAQSQSPSQAQPAGEAVPFDMRPAVVTKPQVEETATAEPDPGDVPEATTQPGEVAPAAEQKESIASGVGSAQLQSPAAKQQEVESACIPRAKRLQTSSMLGLPGSIGGGGSANWGPLLLAVALASGAVALLIWRRRSQAGRRESRDPLETASTVVALISAVVGLALTFVPGVGIDEPPAPVAQIAVRAAHARITHGEYATELRTRENLSKEDKREVGNVIWLRLRLEGYRSKPLRLQYAAYRAEGGGALLPGTTREVDLGSDRDDVETTLVPIWIGHPRRTGGLTTFKAQFRLINPGGQVLEIAKTDAMNASEYRYVC